MKKDTTYLVMKIHSAYAVLVDNDGRFIKAANKGYSVGDIVCDIIPIRYPADRVTQAYDPACCQPCCMRLPWHIWSIRISISVPSIWNCTDAD